jgi:hypothetical protein
MARHGCRGKAAFHLTAMMMWPDLSYDQEHCWLLN